MGRKAVVIEVPLPATNADGSGLYQCPHCNEWTEAEEKSDVKCDYYSDSFRAITPTKRTKREVRVIGIKFPGPKPANVIKFDLRKPKPV